MAGFQALPEENFVVLHGKGAYKQVPMATLNGGLYAKVGASYHRLYSDKSTSNPSLSIVFIESDKRLYNCPYRRLAVEPGSGRVPLTALEEKALQTAKD